MDKINQYSKLILKKNTHTKYAALCQLQWGKISSTNRITA